MVIFPDILDYIASYADAESCLACITVCRALKEAFTVCRAWQEAFTVRLWREVDTSMSPYIQIFACGGDLSQRQR